MVSFLQGINGGYCGYHTNDLIGKQYETMGYHQEIDLGLSEKAGLTLIYAFLPEIENGIYPKKNDIHRLHPTINQIISLVNQNRSSIDHVLHN